MSRNRSLRPPVQESATWRQADARSGPPSQSPGSRPRRTAWPAQASGRRRITAPLPRACRRTSEAGGNLFGTGTANGIAAARGLQGGGKAAANGILRGVNRLSVDTPFPLVHFSRNPPLKNHGRPVFIAPNWLTPPFEQVGRNRSKPNEPRSGKAVSKILRKCLIFRVLPPVFGNFRLPGVFEQLGREDSSSIKPWCARRGSNPQPSASETDALSN